MMFLTGHIVRGVMKKNTKYSYVAGQRFEVHGSRQYDFGDGKLPSVTTILGKTKDQEYLNKWRAKIGHEEADKIFNHSAKRGTSMHKFIENHITGIGYDDLSSIGHEARPMAHKIIEMGLAPVSEYYGSEVAVHYPDLYAGSMDLVCLHNGIETIVDFKQANKPKRKEWIEDYYMQIAAYAMAHDYVHHSHIDKGIIMVCTPDLYFQEFRFEGDEMRSYRHKFLARLNQYYGRNVSE